MALRESLLDKLRNKTGVKKKIDNAKQWFRAKIRNTTGRLKAALKGTTRKDLITQGKHVNEPKIGSIYFYFYDPKWKEELPYYDKFPLMLCIEKYNDGFLGINLHYINPKARAVLLDNLMEVATNQRFDASTKLRVSYGLLKSAGKYKAFKPALKRYLYSHVKSSFTFIPADEWSTAIFLPVEKFVGKSKSGVWSDSEKLY